jgi:elongation factor P
MISTSDFKKGLRVEMDGQPWTIVSVKSQSPSARGAATLVKIRIKNVLTGQVSDRTIKAGEKFDEPDLQFRTAQYLYSQPDGAETIYTFMDMTSYEQFELRDGDMEGQTQWLVESVEVESVVFNERVCGIELPQFVEMELESVEPGSRGDTASGGVSTPALTTTGVRVQVPLYINAGDRVRIDTGTGNFKERVK